MLAAIAMAMPATVAMVAIHPHITAVAVAGAHEAVRGTKVYGPGEKHAERTTAAKRQLEIPKGMPIAHSRLIHPTAASRSLGLGNDAAGLEAHGAVDEFGGHGHV